MCLVLGRHERAAALDRRAVLRRQELDSVVQAGHAQPDFGRARVVKCAVAHGQKLLPNAQAGRHFNLRPVFAVPALHSQPLTPNACIDIAQRTRHANIRTGAASGVATGMKSFDNLLKNQFWFIKTSQLVFYLNHSNQDCPRKTFLI